LHVDLWIVVLVRHLFVKGAAVAGVVALRMFASSKRRSVYAVARPIPDRFEARWYTVRRRGIERVREHARDDASLLRPRSPRRYRAVRADVVIGPPGIRR
jgi:hypothetical protein